MSFIINIILFILILGIIVLVHEFGHFIWAKIAGVHVYEFAIGMGPKLFGKKKGDTEYTIRAIPIGGFCSMAGEDLGEDEDKSIPKGKRLQAKSPWQRFLIMVFGPLNNFILAVILLLFLAFVFGGTTMNPVLTSVEKGTAAYKAGLSKGDRILKINDKKISTSDDVSLYVALADPTKGTKFKVEKKTGDIKTYKVKPEKIKVKDQISYKYGIGMVQKEVHGFFDSIEYTVKKTGSIFKQMFITVGYLFTGQIKLSQLSGPIGIYSIVGESSKAGIESLIYLMAFLSINVGFINLLPIPAFDGGHILFIIIEIIKGSPVKPEIENKIHTLFLMLLMLLMIVITFNDILRLF